MLCDKTMSLLLATALLAIATGASAQIEGAVRVARCRAVCVQELCTLPAYHYAVTLQPRSSECWHTCFALLQGNAYMCQDPDRLCQTEGCKLACRVYNKPLKHTQPQARFPYRPVVTVLSEDWVKVLWAEPTTTGQRTGHSDRALTYLLLWQSHGSREWTPLDITVGIEGELFRGDTAAEPGTLPAKFKVIALDDEGIIAEASVSHAHYIHVTFPDETTPSTKPESSTTAPSQMSSHLPASDVTVTSSIFADVPSLSDAVDLLYAALNFSLSRVNLPQDEDAVHHASSSSPLRMLLIPAALGVLSVVMLLALVALSSCQLQRALRHMRQQQLSKHQEAQERTVQKQAMLLEDEIALEKYLADPKNHFMLSVDSASPLLTGSTTEQSIGYLSLDPTHEDSQTLFDPRFA